jgi:hypothetical protein
MTEYLTIFGLGFFAVFFQGFQSRNVNHGNYGWAAATSFFIGISSAFLWAKIISPEAGSLAGLVYGLSGACGITTAMYIHERFINGNRNP